MVHEGASQPIKAHRRRTRPTGSEACTGVARNPAPTAIKWSAISRSWWAYVAAEEFHCETHLDPTLQEVVGVSGFCANSASGVNQGAVVVSIAAPASVSWGATVPANTTAPAKPKAARQRSNSSPIWWRLRREANNTCHIANRVGRLRYNQGCRGRATCIFASSDNCAALHLARRYSLDAVRKARDFGITTPMARCRVWCLGNPKHCCWSSQRPMPLWPMGASGPHRARFAD